MAGIKGKGGKPGRSGRKSKAEEMGLASTLDRCWPQAQREAWFRKLASLAAGGDMDAGKILMSYAYGRPRESVDLNAAGDVVLRVLYGNDRDPN